MSRLPAYCCALLFCAMSAMAANEPMFVYEPEELALLLSPETDRDKTTDPTTQLKQLLDQPAGDPVIEQRIRKQLLQLALPLDRETLMLVQDMQVRGGVIHVWMRHEGNHRVAVPAIDNEATAAYVLQQHAVHRNAENLLKDIRNGASTVSADDNTWQVAVTRSDENGLNDIRLHLRAALEHDKPVEGAIVSLVARTMAVRTTATRTMDRELLKELIRSGDADALRPRLKNIIALDPAIRTALLQIAVARNDLRDTAVGLLGDELDKAWAWEAVIDSLADASAGTSAAVMLGRKADDARLHDLQGILLDESPGASRAALALHLHGSREAKEILENYLRERPEGQFSSLIREWLR